MEKSKTEQKAIYKIENLINHKIYIGQSKAPQERFKEHCYKKENYISLIGRAINKYGKENFSFEILGWFEDYNEKEKFFISYYRSLAPNGYNIAPGGENPPHLSGEDNPCAKITEEVAKNIQEDLMNYKIPRKQIVKKYNISYDIMRHINDGTSWFNEAFTYPLRPTERKLNEKRADIVINLLLTTNLTQKEIGAKVGWNRSAVTMINIGKNHKREGLEYPLRK